MDAIKKKLMARKLTFKQMAWLSIIIDLMFLVSIEVAGFEIVPSSYFIRYFLALPIIVFVAMLCVGLFYERSSLSALRSARAWGGWLIAGYLGLSLAATVYGLISAFFGNDPTSVFSAAGLLAAFVGSESGELLRLKRSEKDR